MNNNFSSARFGKEYFLVILPVYFVLHGFIENYVSISLLDVLQLIAQYLFATTILSLLFFLIFKSWRKAALYVFALMSFYFFFGALHDATKKILLYTFLVKYIFILPFTLFFFIVLAIVLHKSNRKFSRLALFLNILLVVFLLIDIPSLVINATKKNAQTALPKNNQICDSCNKPDIYLIIADEYAGKQELNEIFNFDNSAFENALRARGFHVIKNSKSNYNFTPFSAASMLSMNYLSNIEGSNSSKHDMNICYGLINENNLWNFFKQNGYEIKNHSIFSVDDIPTIAPQKLLVTGINLITSQTFFSRIDRDIRFNLATRFNIKSEIERYAYYQKKCNEKLYSDLINETHKAATHPRFIYTHLMMPHYPYYFDSNGRPNPLEMVTEGNQIRKKEYIEYLQYCNKKFLPLIDSVLVNSKKPPIIIFMGDHGWRHFTENVNHQYYFMNLLSIYLPDKNYSAFNDSISNVNMFRVLLNNQFQQHLSLLKDSSSFLRD